jgi:hypothetical protein
MVDNDIDQHPDIAAVRGANHRSKVCLCAKAFINCRPVARPIAVIGIGAAPFPLNHAAADILDDRSGPDGIHAEFGEIAILYPLGDAANIAAFETAQDAGGIRRRDRAIIGGIAVGKTVGHQKIDSGVTPVGIDGGGSGSCGGRFRRRAGRARGQGSTDRN